MYEICQSGGALIFPNVKVAHNVGDDFFARSFVLFIHAANNNNWRRYYDMWNGHGPQRKVTYVLI